MTSPSLPAVSNSGFWMLLPFSLLDHRNFVPRLSIYRHWKTLAFSFPLSLQVFHLFHWKACFQFFNTLRNCPWNLSHPGTTNKSTKWSTWEVTVLVLNDTRTQPLLELFILKLFTESCMSSPATASSWNFVISSELLQPPLLPCDCFLRKTCQLISIACIPYSLTSLTAANVMLGPIFPSHPDFCSNVLFC